MKTRENVYDFSYFENIRFDNIKFQKHTGLTARVKKALQIINSLDPAIFFFIH